jgi:LacI family transcriptional regulator
MVTIKEVAESAGVSIATVSRVLSNSSYPVSQEMRTLILKVAQDLGYSPNRAARSLRTDRSSLIGIVLDNFTSYWGSIIIRGLQDVLHAKGYFSLVVNIPWAIHSQSDVVQDLLGHSVDGFVFIETWHSIDERKEMLQNKPYVVVHRLFHESDPFSIIPDDIHNSTLVVEHLIKLGHRRMGYIMGPEDYFSSERRLNGFINSLNKANLPILKEFILRGTWTIPSGYQCAKEMLSSKNLPTTIVAANDLMAYGALLAIQDSGLRVPEDIAIVGYDDDEITRISNPTLTTVKMPLFRMGQLAAENLLGQVNKREYLPEEQLIKGELIIRQSCGSPSGQHIRASDYVRDH